jgi:GNAT superfamily N-acetyltransferase
MLEIKDLDEKTIRDGFCTRPYPGTHKSFEKTGSNLEEALAERCRFLSDRLIEGTVWGKIAYKNGEPAGWIDCFPADLEGWVLIGCIDVEEGLRRQGVGSALTKAVTEEAKKRGVKGVAVDTSVWYHMPKGFFAKCSFVDTDDKADISRMILKLQDVEAPRFPPSENLYEPQLVKGKLVIDLIRTGNCPTAYQTHDIVKKAARRFEDKVIVNEYAASERDVAKRFGKGGCGMYANGEPMFFGYPGEPDDVEAYLQKKVDEIE